MEQSVIKSKRLRSYPKVWNLGHPSIENLLDGEVVVQEKVDGSQFSFGMADGKLFARSKGQMVMDFDEGIYIPNKLFQPAMDTAQSLFDQGLLTEGWIYRGEAFHSPKHNTLAYERMPEGGFILYDVDTGLEKRMNPNDLANEAAKLGLEVVPTLYVGEITTVDQIMEFMNNLSILGGSDIEGVVIKNYNQWGRDGKTLMGKHVSERFKEINRVDFKQRNPSQGDIETVLCQKYRSEARWDKAVQRLKELGEHTGEPKDIGKLMGMVQEDVKDECADLIKDELFKYFWPKIKRRVAAGLPEWYKNILMEAQFSDQVGERLKDNFNQQVTNKLKKDYKEDLNDEN